MRSVAYTAAVTTATIPTAKAFDKDEPSAEKELAEDDGGGDGTIAACGSPAARVTTPSVLMPYSSVAMMRAELSCVIGIDSPVRSVERREHHHRECRRNRKQCKKNTQKRF